MGHWHIPSSSRGENLVAEPFPSAWWTNHAEFLTFPAEDHGAVVLERAKPMVLASFKMGLASVCSRCPRLHLHLQVLRSRCGSRHTGEGLVVKHHDSRSSALTFADKVGGYLVFHPSER